MNRVGICALSRLDTKHRVILVNECNFITIVIIIVLGYWHQRADERHGNPPPR